jgi:hypothetical protein
MPSYTPATPALLHFPGGGRSGRRLAFSGFFHDSCHSILPRPKNSVNTVPEGGRKIQNLGTSNQDKHQGSKLHPGLRSRIGAQTLTGWHNPLAWGGSYPLMYDVNKGFSVKKLEAYEVADDVIRVGYVIYLSLLEDERIFCCPT